MIALDGSHIPALLRPQLQMEGLENWHVTNGACKHLYLVDTPLSSDGHECAAERRLAFAPDFPALASNEPL